MKYGIYELALVNALKHNYTRFDLSKPSQLVAANNTGKSSLIKSLLFLWIDDPKKHESDFHESRKWSETCAHYFSETQPSWIAFSIQANDRCAFGKMTVLVTAHGLGSQIKRFVVRREFNSNWVMLKEGDSYEYFTSLQFEVKMAECGLLKGRDWEEIDQKDWPSFLFNQYILDKKKFGLGIFDVNGSTLSKYKVFKNLMTKILADNQNKAFLLSTIHESLLQIAFSEMGEEDKTMEHLEKNLSAIKQEAVSLHKAEKFMKQKENLLKVQLLGSDYLNHLVKTFVIHEEFSKAHKKMHDLAVKLPELRSKKTALEYEINRKEHDISITSGEIKNQEKNVALISQRYQNAKDTLDNLGFAGVDVNEVKMSFEFKLHGIAKQSSGANVRILEQRLVAEKADFARNEEALRRVMAGRDTVRDFIYKNYNGKVFETLSKYFSKDFLYSEASTIDLDVEILRVIQGLKPGEVVDLGLVKNAKVVDGVSAEENQEEILKSTISGNKEAIANLELTLENEKITQPEIDLLKSNISALEVFQRAKGNLDDLLIMQEDIKGKLSLIEQLKSSSALIKSDLDGVNREIENIKIATSNQEVFERRMNYFESKRYPEKWRYISDSKVFKSILDNLTATEFKNSDLESDSGIENYKLLCDAEETTLLKLEKELAEIARDEKFMGLLLENGVSVTSLKLDSLIHLEDAEPFYMSLLEIANEQRRDSKNSMTHLAANASAIGNALRIFNERKNQYLRVLSGINSNLRDRKISDITSYHLKADENQVVKKLVDLLTVAVSQISNESDKITDMFAQEEEAFVDFSKVRETIEELSSGVKTARLDVADAYTLKLVVVDVSGKQVVLDNLSQIGSTGTVLTARVIFSSTLLGLLLKAQNQSLSSQMLPLYVDEIWQLDEQNVGTVIGSLLKNGMVPIVVTPSSLAPIPSSIPYSIYYLQRSKNGNRMRCIPKIEVENMRADYAPKLD